MRILGSVIQALVLSVLNAGRDLLLRSPIAGQLVGDQDARRPALPLQQLAEQALGGALITPALDQYVEHHPGLVDRAPEPVLLAGDFDGDLLEVPFVSGAGQPPSDSVGERLAELQGPLPHALVAHDDAACSQHLLDHAQAEREAEILPNRVADDLGRKPVAGVAGRGWRCHPVQLRDLARHGKPPTGQCHWT